MVFCSGDYPPESGAFVWVGIKKAARPQADGFKNAELLG